MVKPQQPRQLSQQKALPNYAFDSLYLSGMPAVSELDAALDGSFFWDFIFWMFPCLDLRFCADCRLVSEIPTNLSQRKLQSS